MLNESAVDDHPVRPTVATPFFKGQSSVGKKTGFMTMRGYVDSNVQKGIWKGMEIRVFVEIADLAHCQSCHRMTPYKFSIQNGYIAWRMCARCLSFDERKSIRLLFGMKEREIISNMQDFTLTPPNGG